MGEFFKWLAELVKGAQCWIIVQPWERAVRVRAGRTTVLLEGGLHFRIPYVDGVSVVNTRLRVAPMPSQTVTTKDGRTVTVGGQIAFRVSDPLAAMRALQNPENTVAAYAQAAISRFLSTVSSADLNLAAIEADATKELLHFAAKGLEIETVSVVDFAIVKTFRILQENWRPATGVNCALG